MYLKKGLRAGRQIGKAGQVSLELALSLICVFLLLFGSLKVFIWLNERLVLRQEAYEETRVQAANVYPQQDQQEVPVDESGYPKLNIFN